MESADDLLREAGKLADAGQNDAALGAFTRAIEKFPNHAGLRNDRGTVYDALKRHDEALADYEKALQLDPNHGYAHSNRALRLAEKGRHREALAEFRASLRILPSRYMALVDRKVNAERAVGLEGISDEVRRLYQEGLDHSGKGNREMEIATLSRAVGLAPSAPTLHLSYGLALQSANRIEESVEPLKRALDLWPEFVEALVCLAWAYNSLKRPADAAAVAERGLALEPENPKLLGCRASAYLATSDPASALAASDRAVAAAKDLADGHWYRARALADLGRRDEAREAYRRAAELDKWFLDKLPDWARDQAAAGPKDHAGDPVPDGLDFFMPAPREIGPVLTQRSTLLQGQNPTPKDKRIKATVIGLLIGAAIGGAIDFFWVETLGWIITWPVLFGSLGAFFGWDQGRFDHKVTYVGAEGIACYTMKGARDRVSKLHVMPFNEAMWFFSKRTRHFTNGAYQGTDYESTWMDRDGRVRLKLSGRYQQAKLDQPVAASDDVHYAASAETAWTRHVWERAQKELNETGGVLFPLLNKDWVRIGRGSLDLCFGGKEQKLPSSEIASVKLEDGWFTIRLVGAKNYILFKTGIFKFEYARVPNARVFDILLEELAGLRIT